MKTFHLSIILTSATTVVPVHALEAATDQNNGHHGPKFKKDGHSLYQFVAIVAREKLESGKARLMQLKRSNN